MFRKLFYRLRGDRLLTDYFDKVNNQLTKINNEILSSNVELANTKQELQNYKKMFEIISVDVKYIKDNAVFQKEISKNSRLILDNYKRIHHENYEKYGVSYEVSLKSFDLAVKYILEQFEITGNTLMDFGGRDGKLSELKNIKDKNIYSEMISRIDYRFMDIDESHSPHIIGDFCDSDLLVGNEEYLESCDIVYTHNVLEHLSNPFVAMDNLYKLLKPKGIGIIIAPFSWRYHAVPEDYFRFTHKGLISLLNGKKIEVLESGFDLSNRRLNLNGHGIYNGFNQNDICPVDEFGAFRENWQAVLIFRKL